MTDHHKAYKYNWCEHCLNDWPCETAQAHAALKAAEERIAELEELFAACERLAGYRPTEEMFEYIGGDEAKAIRGFWDAFDAAALAQKEQG